MFSIVLYIFIFALVVFVFSPIFLGVPFLPTHKKQAKKMMELAEIKSGMKVVDLGSGAGRLLFLAAKNGASAVGYELNPFLVLWTKIVILVTGQKNIKVYYKSIYEANIADADVVMMFLYPPHMKKITEKIFNEIKPETKVLSYVFQFNDHKPIMKEQGIYVYKK